MHNTINSLHVCIFAQSLALRNAKSEDLIFKLHAVIAPNQAYRQL